VLVRVDRGGTDTDGAPEEQHPASQGDAAPGNPDQVPGAVSMDGPERDGAELDGAERDSGAGGEGADGGRGVRMARAAEYRDTVDGVYRAYAIDQAYERVREVERGTVTPAMRRIEAEDPERHLAGLENRLKGKDRLTEKVSQTMDEQPDLTHKDAISVVKDAIRYTFQYTEKQYASGVRADTDRLMDAGFDRVDSRNTWDNEAYKGINSRWRVPDYGQLFEVQFHTQASYEAKQETHGAYEKLRDPATSKEEQERLVQYQREVNSRIVTPPGATDIPDYP